MNRQIGLGLTVLLCCQCVRVARSAADGPIVPHNDAGAERTERVHDSGAAGRIAAHSDAGAPRVEQLRDSGSARNAVPTQENRSNVEPVTGDDAGAQSAATSGEKKSQWVLGYYVGYQIDQYPIAEIDWSALTHVAFAPLLVRDDGTLDLGFYDSNGTGETDAKALASAAHAHAVKALLMLGGSGAGAKIAKAATTETRPAFVRALLDTLDSLGYDGLDLDWEDEVNLDDLIALARDLRSARPGIVLSYPAGAINPNFMTVDPKLVELAKPLDRFNVQTYYPSTAFAGAGWSSWFNSPLSGATPSTPIAIDDSLQRYAAAGIPKGKLGFGAGFYAICYTGGVSGPRQATDGAAIVGGDNQFPLRDVYAKGGMLDNASSSERQFDKQAQVPYLGLASEVTDAHCDARATRYVSYEDEQSLRAKGTFSKDNGYGGIIVWTIQQGWLPTGASGGRPRNALMQALKQGFLDD